MVGYGTGMVWYGYGMVRIGYDRYGVPLNYVKYWPEAISGYVPGYIQVLTTGLITWPGID